MSKNDRKKPIIESNPVPTSFFGPQKGNKIKKDVVGTRLGSRPYLVPITFADLPSLLPPSYHFLTCILYILCKSRPKG